MKGLLRRRGQLRQSMEVTSWADVLINAQDFIEISGAARSQDGKV